MSKFTDYLASAITPQYTLLEKFNALLEFLKNIDFENSLEYDIENAVDITSITPSQELITMSTQVREILKKAIKSRCIKYGSDYLFITGWFYTGNIYGLNFGYAFGDDVGLKVYLEVDLIDNVYAFKYIEV